MLSRRNPIGLPLFAGVTLTLSLAGPAIAQRDLTDIPTPDPVAERAAMKVDPAAAVNLYAADPDISKPIQVNFDRQGGLWVASSEVYPQIQPGEKADDKIIVLRDTDGDGAADSRTVFADGLLIPTGVLPDGPHAAYVAESTRLLYLEDTDGDGKSDKRRVVMSGFGTEDTHHLVHTLRWGPDGCVYFNQSIYIHSHIDTPYGSRHLDGGGIWRYRPDTGRLEVVCKGFVNPWGHVFDSVGESFVTDGAYFEGINYVFPDSVFVTSPGATRWLKGLNPGSPKHCGLEILSGSHVPPEWHGDFVANDFRSHRVCRFTVKADRSGYLGRQQPEIVTTPHVAFRPIDARMGPDGALYVADWYNPIIQHGEVDFRDERRDREHGRIWRVSFPGRDLDPWPDFAAADVSQLVQWLEDSSLPVRQFSRQELWRRAAEEPEGVLQTQRRWRDSGGGPRRALEVLWMNEVVHRASLEDARIAVAAADRAAGEAKRTILRSIWRSREFAEQGSEVEGALTDLVTGAVTDPDPRARLESVVSNGQLTGVAAADRILRATTYEIDPNLDFAIWQSLRNLEREHAESHPQSPSLLEEIDWTGRQGELAFAVAAIGTREATETAVKLWEKGEIDDDGPIRLIAAIAQSGDGRQLGRVLKRMLKDASVDSIDVAQLRARLEPLLARAAKDGTIPDGAGVMLAGVAPDADSLASAPEFADLIATAATAWKAQPMEATFLNLLPKADGALREKLIGALGKFDSPAARKRVEQLTQDPDRATRVAATRAMAASRPRAAIAPSLELLRNESTGEEGIALVVGMLGRKELPPMIAASLGDEKLPADRARSLLRRVRSAGGHESLEAAIRKAGSLDNAAWKLTPELSQRILSLVKSQGSASRGEAVYRRTALQCTNCHAIGTAGGLVGPNLISVGGSSQPDYILESLIDPSAKLKEGYTTLSILTEEGEVINGIVVGKTDSSIRLRLADGKERQVEFDEIAQEKPGKSLMPAGALDTLTESELVDMVTFLSELGRTAEFTVSTEPIVRSYETLVYSSEANRRLNRTSTDTAASDDPAMNWRAVTARVDGSLPLSELDRFRQHRETPPTSFVRFVVELSEPGVAGIEMPDKGIEAWIDGKPTPVWTLPTVKLDRGRHTVVIAVDRTEVTEPFSVRLDGDAIEPSP